MRKKLVKLNDKLSSSRKTTVAEYLKFDPLFMDLQEFERPESKANEVNTIGRSTTELEEMKMEDEIDNNDISGENV
jgi:hypothetical protein